MSGNQLLPLSRLPASTKFDLGPAENGDVLINFDVSDFDNTKRLPEEIAISMALSEAGQKSGHGKVFYVVSGTTAPESGLGRTCRLIYTHHRWRSFEGQGLFNVEPCDRVLEHRADYELLPDDVVLPVNYTYQTGRPFQITWATNDGVGKLDSALIIYDGEPHVARRSEWEKIAIAPYRVNMADTSLEHQTWLASIRCKDNTGVMKKLEKMYKEAAGASTLYQYRDVMDETRRSSDQGHRIGIDA